MKKLILAAFAVAFAAVAQAASISWSISKINSVDSGVLAPTTYTAMMFVTANSTGIGDYTITSVDAVVNAIMAKDFTSVGSLASVNKGLNAAGTMGGLTGLATNFATGTLSAFAIIFDTTTATDLTTASHYYLVNGGADSSVSFTTASGTKGMLFGDQSVASAAEGAWQAIGVPEPTSALMLLVGLAGLALKRKVA